MADNFDFTPGTGATGAADDIGGVKYPRVKATWGPDGTANDIDVATGKSLPIQVRSATGLIPIGEPTDAKSAATDTTSVTGISIWKQISASVQALVTALAPASWTFGSGAITAGTPRVTLASDSPGVTAAGQATAANSLPVTLPSDASASVAVSLTRTSDTNAYAANDVIGAATGSTAALTFANMGLSGSRIMITGAQLQIDAAAIISGETSYYLYLYNVTPPSALGDNVAADIPSGDRASFLGKILLGTPVDEGSTLYVETNGINKQVKLAGTSLFAYLVTVGAYTPTSARVHVVTLHAVQL